MRTRSIYFGVAVLLASVTFVGTGILAPAPAAGQNALSMYVKLNDIDDTELQYLSISRTGSPNPYFGGNVPINGLVTIKGPRDDRLISLKAYVIQNGRRVATLPLVDRAARDLLVRFGRDGKIVVSRSRRLFRLTNKEAARVSVTRHNLLRIRVVARTRMGHTVARDVGPLRPLVRYGGTNRYGGRDAPWCLDPDGKATTIPCGGDDWARPGLIPMLNHFGGVEWGDISNMNGGTFPFHDGHRDGVHADGWFPGYDAMDAGTAATLLGILDDPQYGARIQRVIVTYSWAQDVGFRDAILGATLADGRRAMDVIDNQADHQTHFHCVFVP